MSKLRTVVGRRGGSDGSIGPERSKVSVRVRPIARKNVVPKDHLAVGRNVGVALHRSSGLGGEQGDL